MKKTEWETIESDCIFSVKNYRTSVGMFVFHVVYDDRKFPLKCVLRMSVGVPFDSFVVGVFESTEAAMKYAEDIINSVREGTNE